VARASLGHAPGRRPPAAAQPGPAARCAFRSPLQAAGARRRRGGRSRGACREAREEGGGGGGRQGLPHQDLEAGPPQRRGRHRLPSRQAEERHRHHCFQDSHHACRGRDRHQGHGSQG
ncbi:hypothetical protein BN1723_019733, partial [Verticillium longisporum]